MRYKVTMEFEANDAATADDIKEFIQTELSCGGGNRHPADPLFHSLKDIRIITIGQPQASR